MPLRERGRQPLVPQDQLPQDLGEHPGRVEGRARAAAAQVHMDLAVREPLGHPYAPSGWRVW
ncbi:hypothetical protein [Streptomyces umbrinus]|uniref:hypothetical protein n=1 Tax=Streptomyces umbrinus TaxID=67370 RepID=UPI00167AB587|nr:hypothetical protein [Streptomyces umbrinus]